MLWHFQESGLNAPEQESCINWANCVKAVVHTCGTSKNHLFVWHKPEYELHNQMDLKTQPL